jgi:hypothetical protein
VLRGLVNLANLLPQTSRLEPTDPEEFFGPVDPKKAQQRQRAADASVRVLDLFFRAARKRFPPPRWKEAVPTDAEMRKVFAAAPESTRKKLRSLLNNARARQLAERIAPPTPGTQPVMIPLPDGRDRGFISARGLFESALAVRDALESIARGAPLDSSQMQDMLVSDALIPALPDGNSGERIRLCPVCEKIFFARNIKMAACSTLHRDVHGKRRQRRAARGGRRLTKSAHLP